MLIMLVTLEMPNAEMSSLKKVITKNTSFMSVTAETFHELM